MQGNFLKLKQNPVSQTVSSLGNKDDVNSLTLLLSRDPGIPGHPCSCDTDKHLRLGILNINDYGTVILQVRLVQGLLLDWVCK